MTPFSALPSALQSYLISGSGEARNKLLERLQKLPCEDLLGADNQQFSIASDQELINLGLAIEKVEVFSAMKGIHIQGVFSDKGTKPFAACLKHMKQLKQLSMKGTFWDPGAQEISKHLGELTELEHLHVQGWFEDPGMKAFAQKLSSLPKLTHIHIQGRFGDAGVQGFVRVLPLGAIRKWKAFGIVGWFGNTEAKSLGEMLSNMTDLSSLLIQGSFVNPGAQVLAQSIAKLSKLKSLTIQAPFWDEGAQSFTKALPMYEELATFSIHGRFGHKSAEDIVDEVSKLKKMVALTITYVGPPQQAQSLKEYAKDHAPHISQLNIKASER